MGIVEISEFPSGTPTHPEMPEFQERVMAALDEIAPGADVSFTQRRAEGKRDGETRVGALLSARVIVDGCVEVTGIGRIDWDPYDVRKPFRDYVAERVHRARRKAWLDICDRVILESYAAESYECVLTVRTRVGGSRVNFMVGLNEPVNESALRAEYERVIEKRANHG